MLSKLVAYAPDRNAAIARMRRALDEYFIGGIKTNLSLFRRILEHPDFIAARIDTGFLDRLLVAGSPSAVSSSTNGLSEIAALSAALFAATAAPAQNGRNGSAASAGKDHSNGSSNWKRTTRTEALRNQ